MKVSDIYDAVPKVKVCNHGAPQLQSDTSHNFTKIIPNDLKIK